MFELQVALKYLIPRRRSLSTALISAMSVLVISLIVWLVIVFLSITKGIEENWLNKLTSLHAPIRIHPKERYFSSYYYQVDRIASASHHSVKTIGEKLISPSSNPFNPEVDPEPPPFWPKPDLRKDGAFLDPVKELETVLTEVKKETAGFSYQDYEIAGALFRLALERPDLGPQGQIAHLSQMSYLLSFTDKNPKLSHLFMEEESPLLEKGQLPDLGSFAPVLLPKSYIDSGAKAGDVGSLSYIAPTAGYSQEQSILVKVVGFYDPGIMPVGSKCILVPPEITRTIFASSQTFSPDGTPTNGIFVWIDDLKSAHKVKEKIEQKLEEKGLSSYWKVTTFEEFEFSKDLHAQFQSDRTLFLIVAAIILIVACSNIISLLVLLVNDKRKEIAILLSMGAKLSSISFIFAFCGVVMGALGCLFGSLGAYLTLKNLDSLVLFLSKVQGRAAFNPLFFGKTLPSDFSLDAFLFIVIATPLLSLLAGLIPALKASRIHPSSVLRSE